MALSQTGKTNDFLTDQIGMERTMQVAELLKISGKTLVTCKDGDTLVAAAQTLTEARIGAMPVVDGSENLSGIVSERDIVRAMADSGSKVLELTVNDIMTRDIITVSPTTDHLTALELMSDNGFRHLPVVEGQTVHGMISMRDLIEIRIAKALKKSQQLKDIN